MNNKLFLRENLVFWGLNGIQIHSIPIENLIFLRFWKRRSKKISEPFSYYNFKTDALELEKSDLSLIILFFSAAIIL